MKKIMFNDRYGLTKAVLDGIKTMTRRLVPIKEAKRLESFFGSDDWDYAKQTCIDDSAAYMIGETIAVAQSYNDILEHFNDEQWRLDYVRCVEDAYEKLWDDVRGINNKMFVKSELMLYQIQITDIKVERLQDISEEDIYKEGFRKESINNGWGNAAWHWESILTYMDSLGRYKQIRSENPKEAFSFLIDKVSGVGTWERNPWVFAYSFELLKTH